MPVKYYGIYVSYALNIDLRGEGLGRQLAAFLKAAGQREDVRFVVACPSWSKQSLLALCESEGIDRSRFDIMSPSGKPVALKLFELFQARRTKPARGGFRDHVLARLRRWRSAHRHWLEVKVARSRTGLVFVPLTIYLLLLGLLAVLVSVSLAIGRTLRWALSPLARRLSSFSPSSTIRAKLEVVMGGQHNPLARRMYDLVEQHETELLIKLINGNTDVAAWYCPTAFWPSFNDIRAPRLMCVPDVVLVEFPIGFAQAGGAPMLERFETMSLAIKGCDSYVTYGADVKWRTLVDGFAIPARSVHVVHHAPMMLNHWIEVAGFADSEAVSIRYCQRLLGDAMRKSFNPAYTSRLGNGAIKFFFYASQIRPNKNILSLLRAYEFLLRKRLIGHKLILTGNPNALPDVAAFIADHRLENDVLCLHGLSASELAACYKLADVAVNPSFSEGGCPFTFTEALSVGTPVVMARIPVTKEVLDDPALDDLMFFDPYSWRDMAERMEWALQNRERLLSAQQPVYERLTKRSWRDVVDEYIDILDAIGEARRNDEPGSRGSERKLPLRDASEMARPEKCS